MPADLRRGGSSCLFILQAAIDRWHRVIITRAARSLRKQNFGVNEPFGYIVVKGRVALGVIFVPGGNTLEIDVLISGECIERESIVIPGLVHGRQACGGWVGGREGWGFTWRDWAHRRMAFRSRRMTFMSTFPVLMLRCARFAKWYIFVLRAGSRSGFIHAEDRE